MRTKTKNGTMVLALLAALSGCDDARDPGPQPTSIDVRAEPARLWYRTGQDVMLVATVLDASGEELADGVELVWSAMPAATPIVTESDPLRARFTLSALGTTTITGCIAEDDPAVTPTRCDSVVVRVDDGAPSLEVEAPLPGAELDDPSGIVVRGSVADRSVVRVYLNGTAADVDDLGRFETTVPARFGAQHLRVDASDGLTGASQVEMDVLWAPAFVPALAEDGLPSLTLEDGLALRLGTDFFDDEAPFDPAATPVVTRDLADLLELIVTRLDVSSLVPDPVIDSPPAFTLRVPSVSLGQPLAELAVTDDGVDLFLRIGRIEAATTGMLSVEGTSLPLDGTIVASAVAFAHLTFQKESELAEVEVTMEGLEVAIETVEADFDSDETEAVFRLAEGALRTTLEDTLLGAVRDTVASSVPTVLRDALGAVDGALADRTITLDSAPFPRIDIRIDGRMRTLESVYRRELLATLRTTIGTNTPSVHVDSRGVARMDAAAMAPGFFRDGSVALGVRAEMMNGLLYALWSSGLLDIEVTSLLPEAVRGLVSEAHLEGRLPPVLRAPGEGETDDLMLGVGQLELALVYNGEPVRFAVQLEAGVNVDVVANRIALGIAETPSIHVWTLVPPSNERALPPETVEALLMQLWPDLRASLVSSLAIDLPIPAIGDLGGLAPDLAGLTLSLDMAERLRPRSGVLLIEAQLTGSLP